MRVLLPPSEAKTSGGSGRPLAGRAAHPVLGTARDRTLDALEELLQQPRDAVARALLLPPGVVDETLASDALVRSSPTAPALERYAGTVYDGLAFAQLPPDRRRVLGRSVLIFSGLFGVVRGDEAVPAYRVPGKAVLPGIGVAATYWRPVLDTAMPQLLGRGHGLVVDLRSGDYSAMWRPRGSSARQVITVRVLSPLPNGGWGVVSAASKFAKGRLTGALAARLAAGGSVDTMHDVADAWLEAGGLRAEEGAGSELVVYTRTARIV